MTTRLEMGNPVPKAMTGTMIFDSLRQGARFFRAHPYLVLGLALGMIGMASARNLETIPRFAEASKSPFFQLFDTVVDLVALGLSLYAAYRWLPVLGVGAILLFLLVQVPHMASEATRDLPDMLRVLSAAGVSIVGVRLIAGMRRAMEVAQRQQREIAASAELTARALNERIHLLERSAQQEQRMASLCQMIAAVSWAKSPLGMAREFLGLVTETVGAEYASLTLVRADGSLGERVESFREIEPFFVSPRRGGMAEAILKTGQSQYVDDVETDPRANPDLVKAGIRSYLGLPLAANGQMRGILFLHSTRPHAFQEDRQFLESIAQILALPLLRAETQA